MKKILGILSAFLCLFTSHATAELFKPYTHKSSPIYHAFCLLTEDYKTDKQCVLFWLEKPRRECKFIYADYSENPNLVDTIARFRDNRRILNQSDLASLKLEIAFECVNLLRSCINTKNRSMTRIKLNTEFEGESEKEYIICATDSIKKIQKTLTNTGIKFFNFCFTCTMKK